MVQAFLIILIVISSILLVLLFMQSGKVRNIGASIVGTQNVELFENSKTRGFEKIIHVTTFILVLAFVGFSFALFVI